MLRRPPPSNRRALPTFFLIYTLKIRNRRKPRRISYLHFSNLYKSGAFSGALKRKVFSRRSRLATGLDPTSHISPSISNGNSPLLEFAASPSKSITSKILIATKPQDSLLGAPVRMYNRRPSEVKQ